MNSYIKLININDDQEVYSVNIHENEQCTIVLLGIESEGRKTLDVHIDGRGANVQILGITFATSGTQSIHTVQHHRFPHTRSDLLIKSVLSGDAQITYDGLIKIDKNAQQSNAYQRHENLLLSDNVHVDTKPELEILANDVRCTHGATIGKMDEEVVFYMQSRGIPRTEVEKIYIDGFFGSVLNRIDDPELVKKIRSELKEKIT
jgi:Fe-S cluster assembly protein SufD